METRRGDAAAATWTFGRDRRAPQVRLYEGGSFPGAVGAVGFESYPWLAHKVSTMLGHNHSIPDLTDMLARARAEIVPLRRCFKKRQHAADAAKKNQRSSLRRARLDAGRVGARRKRRSSSQPPIAGGETGLRVSHGRLEWRGGAAGRRRSR